jgi:ATP-dependent helicase HrpA
LRAELGTAATQRFGEVAAEGEAIDAGERFTDWGFGELGAIVEIGTGGGTLIGHPALVDRGDHVTLEVRDAPESALAATRAGLLRLFMLHFRDQVKYLEKNLPSLREMGMQFVALGTAEELKAQLLHAAFERTCLGEPWPSNRDEFLSRCTEAKGRLNLIAQDIARLVGSILAEYHALVRKLQAVKGQPAAAQDMKAQLDALVHGRFVAETPFERLAHFPRYLKAVSLRIDKLKSDPARDARLMSEFAPLAAAWGRKHAAARAQGVADRKLEDFRWLLEELRVSLYAQELRTPFPVSVKRLHKVWASMRA